MSEANGYNLDFIVRRLLESSSLEYGWHGNPDNHTLEVTLYFGSRDPRHLFKQDKYGHAKLTMDILRFLANNSVTGHGVGQEVVDSEKSEKSEKKAPS